MAQLKDTIVSGNLRVTDTTLTDTLQVTIIKAPTSSGGTTYGPGTSGQVLKSNGTSVYWTSDSTVSPATAAPQDVSTTAVIGTSTLYARQDHVHAIALATGDNNGQVKIANSNVSVKGLKSAAYTESSAYLSSTTKYAGSSSAGGAATKSYKLIQNGTTRPTTANVACVGDQSVSFMQVSSSMTTGQPAGEGYILNFDWDTTASWQSQLFIPIKYLTPPAYRAQNNNSAWADTNQWVNILTDKFGAGKDGYISFPGDGSYTASQENVTGGLVITLPFGMTSIMMTFVIDIFDYRNGDTVSYRVAGFNYDSDSKWYYCTAICIGKYGSLSSNLTVRFGHNGTKAQIQIGETTTAWKWPQVRIRDILLGHTATQGDKTYLSNKTGWTISFVTTDISNISQTITNTHIGYHCVAKATLTGDSSSDFDSYQWHKFASITCDTANGDYNLTLLVSKTWESYGTNTGILTVHIRTTDTKIYGTSHFGWLLKGTDITADNFKLLYTNTANTKTEVELWYKQESRWDGWIFTVLSESHRDTFSNKWVMYKNWGHGSASLPTATDTVTSSILNISNNAATATTATKAYNIVQNPSTATTYAISFGGAGETGVETPTNGTFTTGAKDHYVNDGLGYRTREGVANGTEGLSALVLGNSLASSVANNKTGYVRQYSINKYYTDLKPNTLTASRTILLPDASGTIAVFPAARTSGQVVVTDGTAGGVKSSGYTIATSVPSGAVFTDAKVTQTAVGSTYTNYRPIVISDANSATEGFSPSTTTSGTFITSSLYCQPSSGMLHANIFKAGKASTTDGEIKFYRSGSGNSGETTLKATAQSTSGTYLLPDCGNGTYTLSIGMTQVGGTGDSLVMSNVSGIPQGTRSFKIVFKSNASSPIYSMVEIPNIGDGVDCGGLIQVGDYTDGQQGSLRIVMKSVIIRVTAGSTTGTKTFTATVSPTQKISGSSVSEFTRNVIMWKIYACC